MEDQAQLIKYNKFKTKHESICKDFCWYEE